MSNPLALEGGDAFDPWSATAAEAVAAAHEKRWFAAQRVLQRRAGVEGGDSRHMMDCVAMCADAGLALPDWLAQAFLVCWRRVSFLETNDWNVALGGQPWGKGARLDMLKRDAELRPAVSERVQVLKAANVPVSGLEFWAAVGKEFGIDHKRAARIFHEAVSQYESLPLQDLTRIARKQRRRAKR